MTYSVDAGWMGKQMLNLDMYCIVLPSTKKGRQSKEGKKEGTEAGHNMYSDTYINITLWNTLSPRENRVCEQLAWVSTLSKDFFLSPRRSWFTT